MDDDTRQIRALLASLHAAIRQLEALRDQAYRSSQWQADEQLGQILADLIVLEHDLLRRLLPPGERADG